MPSTIGPYQPAPVALVPYDSRAARAADHVAHMIEDRLPHVTVEHIGSTAVPGCDGKGVVDLVAAYQPGDLESVKDVLRALGFQPQTSGHAFPEDRPMRTGSLSLDGATFQLHIHVIARDSPELARLLIFRDRLRGSPELAATYIDRKRDLIEAGLVNGADYSEAKGPFIEDALTEGGERTKPR